MKRMQVPAQKQLWESPHQALGPRVTTTGAGVGVVVMDEGFDLRHPDLQTCVATAVGSGPDDSFEHDAVGHGTHVLGILGASGQGCEGAARGIAPGARLIPMKLEMRQDGDWQKLSAQFARNVHWAVQNKAQFNIGVLSCSFVLPLVEGIDAATQAATLFNPFGAALKMAHEAGITVVAGVGNSGPGQNAAALGALATYPSVIAVGALDTAGTPDDFSDDRPARFSSDGVSYLGQHRPDLLAPGVRIMSTNAPECLLETRNQENLLAARQVLSCSPEQLKELAQQQVAAGRLPGAVLALGEEKLRKIVLRCFDVKATLGQDPQGHALYQAQDGSSMATPLVSGVVAHMLEANPRLTPDQVRAVLTETARPVAGSAVPALQADAAIERARFLAG